MNELDLGLILKRKYNNPSVNKTPMIHVLAIKYGHIIKENQLSAKEILKYAGMSETYVTEIHKGMRLAKYVTLKANCSDL